MISKIAVCRFQNWVGVLSSLPDHTLDLVKSFTFSNQIFNIKFSNHSLPKIYQNSLLNPLSKKHQILKG